MNDQDLKKIVEKHGVKAKELNEQIDICKRLMLMSDNLTKEEFMENEKARDLLLRLNTCKREQYISAQIELFNLLGMNSIPGKSDDQLVTNFNTIYSKAETVQEKGDDYSFET